MSFGLGIIEIAILVVLGVAVLAVMTFALGSLRRRDVAPGVRCPHCAKPMPPSSKICSSCGHTIAS